MSLFRNNGYLFFFDGRVEYFEFVKTEDSLHYAEWVTNKMVKGDIEMLIEMHAIKGSIDDIFNLCVCVGNRDEPYYYSWFPINHDTDYNYTAYKDTLRDTHYWDTFLENRNKALALEFLKSN